MTTFALSKDIFVFEVETSEKIDERYLKNFVLSNLKLKNINLNPNNTIYINFIENIKEYQFFIIDNSFKYFEFEAFYSIYQNKKVKGFELFICDDFFVIFKDSSFYYYQKISQNINQDDFLQFLDKKFKIKIEKIHQINSDFLKDLKIEFLKTVPKKYSKEPLKKIELKRDFSFYIYVFYIFIVIFCSYYYYEDSLKVEEKIENIVNIEDIKEQYAFRSFEDSFYEILKNIDKNGIVLISFEFRQNMAKIVLNSQKKENINIFLENCKNVFSSSINFIEDSKTFEATIDVEFSQK
ncbi:hypothetical protein ACNSOS_09435 [Aliarcobacter vitoriensis]|uniref:hypothetical protein n=1 Tax=Aliarcobacter vitoriensis TaxID=2011099 RepID=UPI003AAD2A6E